MFITIIASWLKTVNNKKNYVYCFKALFVLITDKGDLFACKGNPVLQASAIIAKLLPTIKIRVIYSKPSLAPNNSNRLASVIAAARIKYL